MRVPSCTQIDGVICCNFHGELEDAKLAQLARVAKATGAKVKRETKNPVGLRSASNGLEPHLPRSQQVVLSSDWRRQLSLKQKVQRALKKHRVGYVGCTPQRVVTERAGNWIFEKPCRPQEIMEWLRQYREGCTCPWVAIDDRDLLEEICGDQLHGHFIHTLFSTGLTASLADECIRILGEAPQPPSPTSVVP